MFHAAGDAPTVTGAGLVCHVPYKKPHATADQIPRLLVWMGVARQDGSFAQPELGHQGLLAVNESLALDAIEGRAVSVTTLFLEHPLLNITTRDVPDSL